MARLPAHKAEQARQDLWTEMRRRKHFTKPDLEKFGGLSRDAIRDYVRGLERAGILKSRPGEKIRKPSGTVSAPHIYTIVKDVGVEAPRVRKDGTEVTQGTGREQLWRTMRMLGTFNFKFLALYATTEQHAVSEGEAKKYLQVLEKAGYLKVLSAGAPGKPTEYRLIAGMNTGPQPPQIQRRTAVYDPNLRKVVWDNVEGKQ